MRQRPSSARASSSAGPSPEIGSQRGQVASSFRLRRVRAARTLVPARLAALILIVTSVGCGRCGRTPPPPERFLPADAATAVLIPRLGDAAIEWGGLLKTLLTVPAAADLGEWYAAVKSQLGFDPLDPAGLVAAGLDPDRGAGRDSEDAAGLPVPLAGRPGPQR